MADQENEYEVESIVQARIEKQAGKLIWKFCVKWKGYDRSDNTWEPVESFDGSENLLDQFWDRIDTGGRDVNDLRLFSSKEEFYPKGPPRRKGKRKLVTAKEDKGQISAVAAVSEGSKSRPEKRRRSSLGEAEASPAKRSRGRANSGKPSSKSQRRLSPSRGETRKKSVSQSGVRSRRYQSSSDVAASEDSEDEIMRDYLVEPSGDEMSRTVTNGSSNPQPDNPPLKPYQKPPGYRRSNIVLDEPNIELSPDIQEQPPDDAGSLFDDPDPLPEIVVPITMDVGKPSVSQTPAASSSSMPSHRARVAKPLVKMVDPTFRGMDGGISTKARLLGGAPMQGPSHKEISSGQSSSRPSNATGSAQKGLQRNKSSLLTFQKGALKTVKGKYTLAEDANTNAEMGGTAAEINLSGDDAFNNITWRDEPADADADSDTIPGISNHNPSSKPSQPTPTAEELLQAAGLDIKEAEALPDFEEDAPAVVTTLKEVSTPQESTPSILQKSLTLAKDNLFPTGLSSTSVTNAVSAAWKRSTIFGPLGLGTDVPKLTSEMSDSVTSTHPFLLALDPSVSISIILKDISVPSTGSPSLDLILSNCPKGPPGKFYREKFAHALLDTLRTGGSSARVGPYEGMNEDQERHFDRFCERLNSGEIFVAVVGSEVLAFFSSNNALIGQRLNVPPALLGLLGNILVTRVVIEKYSAYADAAIHADVFGGR